MSVRMEMGEKYAKTICENIDLKEKLKAETRVSLQRGREKRKSNKLTDKKYAKNNFFFDSISF